MKFIERIIKFGNALIAIDSTISSRAFLMLLSGFAGMLVAMTICIVLLIDVCCNGKIDSNMSDMGWLLLGAAGLITGGSIGKILKGKYDKK